MTGRTSKIVVQAEVYAAGSLYEIMEAINGRLEAKGWKLVSFGVDSSTWYPSWRKAHWVFNAAETDIPAAKLAVSAAVGINVVTTWKNFVGAVYEQGVDAAEDAINVGKGVAEAAKDAAGGIGFGLGVGFAALAAVAVAVLVILYVPRASKG